MGGKHSHLRILMLCCLVAAFCSACGPSSSGTKVPLEPTRVSSTPRPLQMSQITGTVFVATQPSVGTGGTVSALLAQRGSLLWSFQTSVTYLTLTYAQGTVYVVGSQLSSAGQARVYALNALDGSLLWSIQLPAAGLSAPLINNGTVYVASPSDGTVYAVRGGDGTLLWFNKTGVIHAGSSPLVLANGLLYVGSNDSGTVVALGSSDGHLAWSTTSREQGISDLTVSGNVLYFLGGASNGSILGVVHALWASDGTQLWRHAVGEPVLLSLILSQNVLYFSTPAGGLFAVRADNGTVLWRVSLFGAETGIATFQVKNGVLYAVANMARGVFALRSSDGTQLWKYQDLQVAPAWVLNLDGGTVYVTGDSTDATTVFALAVGTGSLLWRSTFPSAGTIPSTVRTVPGAVVIVQANTGTLSLLNRTGKEVWSLDLKCFDPVAPFPISVAP